MTGQLEQSLLNELENADWTRQSTGPHVFSVPSISAWKLSLLDQIQSGILLPERKDQLEQIFQCNLGNCSELEVHKYSHGDGIAPHTDHQLAEVRVVLNINRGWHLDEGGVWVLATDPFLKTNTCYLPPLSRCGFCFSTNENTFHALSRYEGRELYCLVLRMPRI